MQPRTAEMLKKPYKPPVLTIHGTVKDLTRAVGPHGTKDGGPGMRHGTAL